MNTNEFVLPRQLRAVHLSEANRGTIATLPLGARVSIVGPSTLPGFVEVICANVRYNVFEEDLRASGSEKTRTAAG